MSIEQLLFFVLLIALPLLERLVSAMRARRDSSQVERTPAPAQPTVLRPSAPVSASAKDARVPETLETVLPLPGLPLPPAVPSVPQRRRPGPLPASEREPPKRQDRKERRAPSVLARHSDRPPALQRSIASGDLRRTIVLIAILGPCRALEPTDAGQLG